MTMPDKSDQPVYRYQIKYVTEKDLDRIARSAAPSPELMAVAAKLKANLEEAYPDRVAAAVWRRNHQYAVKMARMELKENDGLLMGEPASGERPKIAVPPGHYALSLLKVLFSEKAFNRVFAQTVLDFRLEHSEALALGRVKLAHWRHVQLVVTLALTALAYLGTGAVKKVAWLWKLGS